MIKIPYEQIIERIKNEANISESEIEARIQLLTSPLQEQGR